MRGNCGKLLNAVKGVFPRSDCCCTLPLCVGGGRVGGGRVGGGRVGGGRVGGGRVGGGGADSVVWGRGLFLWFDFLKSLSFIFSFGAFFGRFLVFVDS